MEHHTGTPYDDDDRPEVTPSGPGGGDVSRGNAYAPGSDAIGTDVTPRRRLGRRSTAIAAGALVLVAAGGAAAWAVGSAPTPSPSAGTQAQPGESGTTGPGGSGAALGSQGQVRPGPPGHGLGHARRGALHGELTVPDGSSGYRQVLIQRGEITELGNGSMTVKSADGFTHTYTLNAGTVVNGTKGDSSSLAKGDTVAVLADGDGTALRVREPRARADAGGPDVQDPVPGILPPGSGRRHGPGPAAGPAAGTDTPTPGAGSSGALSSSPGGRTT